MPHGHFRRQIELILDLDKLKAIVRRSYLSDASRRENWTEHSWHTDSDKTVEFLMRPACVIKRMAV